MTTIEKHFSESSKTILSLKNFKKEINEIIESILKCDKNKKKFSSLAMADLVPMQNTLLVNFHVLLIKETESHFQQYP